MFMTLLLLAGPLFLPLLFLGILFLPFILFWLIVFQSVQTLILTPISLWQTFTNKQVRRNHALEHATANVLEEKYGSSRVAGMAFKDGFKLFGDLPHPSLMVEAAREGLQRLRNGESRLAIHPRCGTALAIGQFIFAASFIFIVFFLHSISIIDILLAIGLSFLLSKPLGLLAQKFLTTSTDVKDMKLVDLKADRWGQFYFLTDDTPVYKYRPFWSWRHFEI